MKVEAAGAARWLQSPMLHNILGFLPPLSEIFSLYVHTASQDGRFQPQDVCAGVWWLNKWQGVVVVKEGAGNTDGYRFG